MVITCITFCNVKELYFTHTVYEFYMVLGITAITDWVIQQTRNVCSEV